MNDVATALKIKECYESRFLHAFPVEDVAKLRTIDPANWHLLHGNLDIYFGNIAGYASSADRLNRRPRAELVEAREYLSRSFFDKHKSLAGYRNAITLEATPNLFRDLETAEGLRQDLLVVIDEILSCSTA